MLKNNPHSKKAERLLTALRNALDCGNAIVFMLKVYTNELQLQTNMTMKELTLRHDNWNHQLETVIKDMEQKLHLIILYDGLSPIIMMRCLPNSFEIHDMLNRIGYNSTDYYREYNPEKDTVSTENFIVSIKTLESYIARTFKVLVKAEYQGKWQYWGKRFSDLYMNMPYGISMNISVSSNQTQKKERTSA